MVFAKSCIFRYVCVYTVCHGLISSAKRCWLHDHLKLNRTSDVVDIYLALDWWTRRAIRCFDVRPEIRRQAWMILIFFLAPNHPEVSNWKNSYHSVERRLNGSTHPFVNHHGEYEWNDDHKKCCSKSKKRIRWWIHHFDNTVCHNEYAERY